MPKQSTRHSYKSRRERNSETGKKARLILIFAVIIFVLMILRNWREHYAWIKTYFYDL